MMRKVSDVEGLEIPFTIIEHQEDGVIIDIPTSERIEVLNDNGEIEYEEIAIVPTLYGEDASWADVKSLFYFDIKIGKYNYSWKRKNGCKHIGIKDNKIGLVKYSSVHANGKELGKTKKTVVPSMLGNPALHIIDGYIAVNGQSYADTQFFDVSTNTMSTLGGIKRIRDGVEYDIKVKEHVIEELI